ncbi:hypothetical protein E0H73_40120 [Kribbella pittospori]|uniref:Uncharacterized protein n=1 Tax=Kribbella pittospori TaxID=722689 RepID=A0A4R0KA56_9ACTN|nr:hypothetical protein [Kribbella pittospori]TCC52145.1 hypothetical protein E0H73_40120 [Kribbella pittospori]
MNDVELGQVQHHLAEVARRHGRTLGTVHVEELPTDPEAFNVLLASLAHLDVPAVIIPTKAHLGRWDLRGSKYDLLQQVAKAEVIVAEP